MKPFCFSLSGIYESEGYAWEQAGKIWDLRELRGTDGYLDPETEQFLEAELGRKKETKELPRIRLLDSGNYHYMSRIWLEKLNTPFRLVVFDNHTDMQPPAFGGLLSCGGWVAASLEELPLLKEVLLVGPDQEAFDQTEPVLREKVRFLSREKLGEMTLEEKVSFFEELTAELPTYLSVDKDVLCPEEASTTWSQGEMTLEELCEFVKILLEKQDILGMDVCGECDPDACEGDHLNDLANRKLLELWRKER